MHIFDYMIFICKKKKSIFNELELDDEYWCDNMEFTFELDQYNFEEDKADIDENYTFYFFFPLNTSMLKIKIIKIIIRILYLEFHLVINIYFFISIRIFKEIRIKLTIIVIINVIFNWQLQIIIIFVIVFFIHHRKLHIIILVNIITINN